MKKRLALLLAGAAAISTLGLNAAMADDPKVTVEGVGTAAIQNGDELWFDGASTLGKPAGGYVAIHGDDGDVWCASEGGPYSDDGSDSGDWVRPEEGDNFHCP